MCSKKESTKPFINPHIGQTKRSFFDVILWKMGYYNDKKPLSSPPDSFSYPLPDTLFDPAKPSAIWINHSTFLIQADGFHFLTDPIWSNRCSPSDFFGPIRRHKAAIEIEELPKIDYVLISHNHYDHLDKPSVLNLFKRFPEIQWIVPTGVKKWFHSLGITKVDEFGWWEEKNFPKLKITAVPAQHFSGRTLWDLNHTLWSGYVVETQNKRFYFVGDTGYNPYDFKKIGEKWGSMDLSLIPIGCYVPRRFMSPVHIEPADSVRIHQDVHSRLSIGMHWKTFHLSDEPAKQPPYDLFLAMQDAKLNPKQFIALEPGYAINW